MPAKTVATVNSTGRQAASFIRAAAAVGWRVKAQIRNRDGLVATELGALPQVEFIEGDLAVAGPTRRDLLNRLFAGARIAFINTTHWGDEVSIGKECADAARRAGVTHYIYSSMPDHSTFDPTTSPISREGTDNDDGQQDEHSPSRPWRALPMWASKFAVENYVRQIGIPATFVYTGIYNNNFTSLPYPLFQMELQPDGSFVWQAPFHPHDPLPWLDAEHDVGPALLQIFKMGPGHWKGQRVTLAFEKLTPLQCCARFSRGVGRPVRYVHGPIKINVCVPSGYREHLDALAQTLGARRAPYFGPLLEYPRESRSIWEGWRGIEEYAREAFITEEWNNGQRWMVDERSQAVSSNASSVGDVEGGDGDAPTSTPSMTSGQPSTSHLQSHPEANQSNFFVGSC